MLGITEEYTHFDVHVITHINTAFAILNQLGVGPDNGFFIRDKEVTWGELIPSDNNLELVKTYTHAKTQILFDPPLAAAAIDALSKSIAELEWRISCAVDFSNDKKEETNE